MKRLLVVAITLTLIVGCYKTPTAKIRQSCIEQEIVTQSYSLEPFKSIVLKGNTAIELANGSYAASITGIKESLNGYQFNIKDQVLYVGTTASASNVAIKLFAPGLKNLTVTDNATINAKNFKTAGLNVLAKNNGTINLEGQYAVNKLYQLGNGRINISWIDSEKLFIDSDSKGPIYLAGIVNSMVIKLTHNAYLDARYLRAQKASVFTTDNARADVLVLDTLGAFAIDKSNIYYYKRPPHFTVVTKGKGNVLHPDWIH